MVFFFVLAMARSSSPKAKSRSFRSLVSQPGVDSALFSCSDKDHAETKSGIELMGGMTVRAYAIRIGSTSGMTSWAHT